MNEVLILVLEQSVAIVGFISLLENVSQLASSDVNKRHKTSAEDKGHKREKYNYKWRKIAQYKLENRSQIVD